MRDLLKSTLVRKALVVIGVLILVPVVGIGRGADRPLP